MRKGVVPDPDPVWKEQGQTVCSCCLRSARCLALVTESGMGDLCEGCLIASISPAVKAQVDQYFAKAPGPANPREQHLFRGYQPERAHFEIMAAIGRRYYWRPEEAKAKGFKSLEDAVNRFSHPVVWLLEVDTLPEWLESLLHRVPGKRLRRVS